MNFKHLIGWLLIFLPFLVIIATALIAFDFEALLAVFGGALIGMSIYVGASLLDD